jgi:hypothetical protein
VVETGFEAMVAFADILFVDLTLAVLADPNLSLLGFTVVAFEHEFPTM